MTDGSWMRSVSRHSRLRRGRGFERRGRNHGAVARRPRVRPVLVRQTRRMGHAPDVSQLRATRFPPEASALNFEKAHPQLTRAANSSSTPQMEDAAPHGPSGYRQRGARRFSGPAANSTPSPKCIPTLDLKDAYNVTAAVRAQREARGERPIGRKIGFTNRTIWEEYGVYAPIWGYVYDRTVRDLTQRAARSFA